MKSWFVARQNASLKKLSLAPKVTVLDTKVWNEKLEHNSETFLVSRNLESRFLRRIFGWWHFGMTNNLQKLQPL